MTHDYTISMLFVASTTPTSPFVMAPPGSLSAWMIGPTVGNPFSSFIKQCSSASVCAFLLQPSKGSCLPKSTQTDGGGPSTSSHGSQSPHHEERLDQGERLAPRNERLGREEGKLPMERLGVELDRLGPLTRSTAKHVQAQVDEATDGREKALYMLHQGPIGVLSR